MRFLRFWWDFVVGDDWRAALGIVVGIAATAVFRGWWAMPAATAIVLAASLRRAARRDPPGRADAGRVTIGHGGDVDSA